MSDSDSDSSLQARVVAQVIKMPRKPAKARKVRAAAAVALAPDAPEPVAQPEAPAPEAVPEPPVPMPPVVDRKAILVAARAAKAVLKQATAAEKAFAALRHKAEMAALREKVEAAKKVKLTTMILRDLRAANRVTGSEASSPTRGPQGPQGPRARAPSRGPTRDHMYTFA
jgi:hypothetical protein